MLKILSYISVFMLGSIITLFLHCCLIVAKSSEDKDPEIYVNLALAQAQGNNFDSALTTLRNAQAKFPKNSQIESTVKNISSMKILHKLAGS